MPQVHTSFSVPLGILLTYPISPQKTKTKAQSHSSKGGVHIKISSMAICELLWINVLGNGQVYPLDAMDNHPLAMPNVRACLSSLGASCGDGQTFSSPSPTQLGNYYFLHH
jgi:hypothetical protein